MFKNMLPQEAQVSRRSPSQMDSHLRGSAFAPLAVALHLASLRLKKLINKRAKALKSKNLA